MGISRDDKVSRCYGGFQGPERAMMRVGQAAPNGRSATPEIDRQKPRA